MESKRMRGVSYNNNSNSHDHNNNSHCKHPSIAALQSKSRVKKLQKRFNNTNYDKYNKYNEKYNNNNLQQQTKSHTQSRSIIQLRNKGLVSNHSISDKTDKGDKNIDCFEDIPSWLNHTNEPSSVHFITITPPKSECNDKSKAIKKWKMNQEIKLSANHRCTKKHHQDIRSPSPSLSSSSSSSSLSSNSSSSSIEWMEDPKSGQIPEWSEEEPTEIDEDFTRNINNNNNNHDVSKSSNNIIKRDTNDGNDETVDINEYRKCRQINKKKKKNKKQKQKLSYSAEANHDYSNNQIKKQGKISKPKSDKYWKEEHHEYKTDDNECSVYFKVRVCVEEILD